MALYLVPTPIGNPDDFTIRGVQTLKDSDVIILEEFKESSRWLRSQGITGKPMEQLNEHSTADDLKRLVALCLDKKVSLITDCGTPGFSDPGADLVALCRQKKITVHGLPGASSLMALLSLSSMQLQTFLFRGFLPAENVAREAAWVEVAREKRALILMDTPYRLQKMMSETVKYFPNRKILLTLNLTQAEEQILEGKPAEVEAQIQHKKAEFMLLVYPG